MPPGSPSPFVVYAFYSDNVPSTTLSSSYCHPSYTTSTTHPTLDISLTSIFKEGQKEPVAVVETEALYDGRVRSELNWRGKHIPADEGRGYERWTWEGQELAWHENKLFRATDDPARADPLAIFHPPTPPSVPVSPSRAHFAQMFPVPPFYSPFPGPFLAAQLAATRTHLSISRTLPAEAQELAVITCLALKVKAALLADSARLAACWRWPLRQVGRRGMDGKLEHTRVSERVVA